jgi:hypothetical protein
LLKSARELIQSSNYGSASVDDLCTAAGVHKGSFYYNQDVAGSSPAPGANLLGHFPPSDHAAGGLVEGVHRPFPFSRIHPA